MSLPTAPPRNQASHDDTEHRTAIAEGAERLRRRQRSLTDQYKHEPEAAWVLDRASTSAEQPLDEGALDAAHTWVEVGHIHPVTLPVAVHTAVGGLSDYPVPGDILCAALASCTDSTIRVVANAVRVELKALRVEVAGEVDVRGCLLVSPDVPVGFQNFRVKVFVRAAPGTDMERLERVLATAERSCVVMQTIRAGVSVSVEYDAASLPEPR
jgi:uncharacterized OsmC-like protein